MAKNNELESPSINLVGNGTTIKGEIITSGDIRIDGSLNGNLKSSGKIVVGTTGQIDGEVSCKNADFSGNVKGKVVVSELLSLKATAKLTGDIMVSKLAIEPGAHFTGKCNMNFIENKETSKIENNKDGEKQENNSTKKPIG